MEDGGWMMEDGGWRMEDEVWRMEDGVKEDGGWRMEDGGRVECVEKIFYWKSAFEGRLIDEC